MKKLFHESCGVNVPFDVSVEENKWLNKCMFFVRYFWD